MIFFAIVITVNLVVNFYIYMRSRSVFPGGNAGWWAATILFWIIAFSYVIGRFTERAGMMSLAEPFIKAGSWWLGGMVYLTLLFLLIDFFRGINGLFNFTEVLQFSWSDVKAR